MEKWKMVNEPDVEIQIKKGNVEIQRYFKKQVIQVVGFKTLKIIDEKGNLVLRRYKGKVNTNE